MTDLHDDAEWLESIASDWHHDRERARFRAIAARLARAAALEAGLRELVETCRARRLPEAHADDDYGRGKAAAYAIVGNEAAALLAEHWSES